MINKRILIVHEDPCVSYFLEHFFVEPTVSVQIESHYADVVKAISKEPFDVIITDLTINGNFTYRYLESLREYAPATSIVVISEIEFNGTKDNLIQMGANDFVTLPLDLWGFTKKINRLLCA